MGYAGAPPTLLKLSIMCRGALHISMKLIYPETLSHPPLRLSSAYPFISGTSKSAFQNARISLKLSCLLHDRVTLPTSLVVKNPFLRTLIVENTDFLRSGSLLLDMRATSGSLRNHIVSKYGSEARPDDIAIAEFLESESSAAMLYDESKAAGKVKTYVLAALRAFRERARKAAIQHQVDIVIRAVESLNGVPTLEQTADILNGSYLSSQMRKVAHFIYCAVGAEITNGVPLITSELWEAANISAPKIAYIGLGNTGYRDVADAAVMDYFAVRRDAIDRLNASDIIELRSEPLTHRYIAELDAAISEANDAFSATGAVPTSLTQDSTQLASEIEKRIIARCQAERRRDSRDSKVLYVIDEVGGAFIPFVATAKKGMAKLARTTARRTGAGWIDYTTTPISTHVTRFHTKVVK